jgi:ABC-type multidrug transport system fused ATPase/permease subunit
MMAALLPLQNAVATIRSVAPQAERAQQIIREARSQPTSNPPAAGMVSKPTESPTPQRGFDVCLENVSFQFDDGEGLAVDEVSLEISSGTYAAFVGPSGAGKTTLADLILGVFTPLSGEVRVGGVDPESRRLAQPGSISYVPQQPGTVSGSIAENVALGVPLKEIDRERVVEVLTLAELWDFVGGLPDGIDSALGKQSDALSGGQIQRLGLARALYPRPRLLVLDEATSALDASTEASIARTIEQLGPETTVIVIAHRLSTIQRADLVCVIDGGRIIARGSFAEVRKAVPLIEEYVQYLAIGNE